ncbi:hypothetical protein AHAS_Ahas15G0210900 [Arachis hypogaea]
MHEQERPTTSLVAAILAPPPSPSSPLRRARFVTAVEVFIVAGVVGAAVAGERASTNLRRERERYDTTEEEREVFCHCSHVSSPLLPSMEVVVVAKPLHRRTSSLEDRMEKLASSASASGFLESEKTQTLLLELLLLAWLCSGSTLNCYCCCLADAEAFHHHWSYSKPPWLLPRKQNEFWKLLLKLPKNTVFAAKGTKWMSEPDRVPLPSIGDAKIAAAAGGFEILGCGV